jgi:capsular exopolysaccharide synthesis family protein
MTNEMQLAQAAGLANAMEHANGANNAKPKPIGLKKIHRLLRGRYPLVITLGLIFGIAGGLTGFLLEEPLFTSSSQVEVTPTVQSPNEIVGNPISDYERLLQSQVAVIRSYELIQSAMNQDEWKSAGGPPPTETAMVKFASQLTAENYPTDTSMLRISFSDPDRNLALAGAQSILKAYMTFYDQDDPMMYTQKLQELDKDRAKYQQQLNSAQQTLRDVQSQWNTDDLTSFQSTAQAELGLLANQLNEAKLQLDIDQKSIGRMQGGVDASGNPTTRSSPLTADQIAAFDGGVLKQMQDKREQIAAAIEQMRLDGYGDGMPKVQQLRSALAINDREIEQYIQSFNQGYRVDTSGGKTGLTSVRGEIVMLQVKIDDLQTQYDKQKALCSEIGRYSQIISDAKDAETMARDNLRRTEADYDRLQSVQNISKPNQLRIISTPMAPTKPSSDTRRVMGVFGFVGGALLPTLVVILLSFLDGRFRYSDEANSDMNVPLLGILPNLPDLLTDPTQAATAAHCVHQIRTILQITGHSAERRVFAITSASPGDGKTSLTLALGLSFAASGSRTLLIDGDLIGGGLTARLNVNAEHGILESMASRDIGPFIRTTDVADLSFLPVGRAMGGYTGTISPAAVRRLVDEARKQFDVILIDTGPILGSIEASPVAVAADGVVLCVSRGQQRQLVDRALEHLKAIGAHLAGVVFNRAQAHDFERSTNRLGLSSVPAGSNGRRSEAIGPVARAVASSVRSAGPGNDQ